MAQWVRAFAVQARGPEFKSPAPHKKPGMIMQVCKPSTARLRREDPWDLLVSRSSHLGGRLAQRHKLSQNLR